MAEQKVVMIDITEKLGMLEPSVPIVNGDGGAAVRGQMALTGA